jgi:hypothetical protein
MVVANGKVYSCREYWAENPGKPGHEGQLPVGLSAENLQVKGIYPGLLMEIYPYAGKPSTIEVEPGIAEAEVLCCVHKLQEEWSRKG